MACSGGVGGEYVKNKICNPVNLFPKFTATNFKHNYTMSFTKKQATAILSVTVHFGTWGKDGSGVWGREVYSSWQPTSKRT